ncbi:hypothetical protein BC939DRAFT_506785 [Gamsiella multidivaricata]|uniref:uncharacterized protein n=1 Tax=Gamsiella multidivaricata TaxID=101098 RepID=UPI0022209310|nr:uncharacterized protein BC939DRAFT_506785 [Gamsiella multidivaricata]KAI7818157.1 hypothetical protein BC939DRAFT_506785 [Gamsiella multidivaricata]
MPEPTTDVDVHELYSRLLGNPQANVERAITTFVEEFETKRGSLEVGDDTIVPMLRNTPAQLNEAKETLNSGLGSTGDKAKMTLERLQRLQQSIAMGSENKDKAATATQLSKEAFQMDIDEAKAAFDQEMALRHADVVKQYVGAFVQQIDHYT